MRRGALVIHPRLLASFFELFNRLSNRALDNRRQALNQAFLHPARAFRARQTSFPTGPVFALRHGNYIQDEAATP